MSFWPQGLNIQDIATPECILEEASEDWLRESGGVVKLVYLRLNTTKHGQVLEVQAQARTSNKCSTLLFLQCKDEGYPAIVSCVDPTKYPDCTLFICDTPGQLRQELKRRLDTGLVKAKLIVLLFQERDA